MPNAALDILRRFRPVAAPGPPAPAGVPADRRAEAEAELAVVFAALAPTLAEARRIREEGRAVAEARRRSGADEAGRILADARARVDEVRVEAAATVLATVEAERSAVDAAVVAEVERIRAVSAERSAAVVAAVIDAVRAFARSAPATSGSGAGTEP